MNWMDFTRGCAALAWCVASVCAQEPAQKGGDANGAERFAAGDYAGAAVAFEKELQSRKEDPALLYNRALAAFRAGDLAAAEDAIERYAAAPGGGRADLHKGLVGNIRYREAEALRRRASGDAAPSPLQPRGQQAAPQQAEDPIPLLEEAIEKAKAARDTFASAADGKPEPAIARNLERALRLIAELEKQLEDAKKQRDEQQKQDGKDGDQQKQDDQKSDDQKQSEEKDQQDQKDQQQKPDDSQQQDQQEQKKQDGEPQGQERPEPKPQQDPSEQQPQPNEPQNKPDEKPEPEPKDGEAKPEPKPGDKESQQEEQAAQPRSDAPGEQQQATQLSPEQRQRLLEQLKDLDGRMQQIRMQSRSRARPVDRDW